MVVATNPYESLGRQADALLEGILQGALAYAGDGTQLDDARHVAGLRQAVQQGDSAFESALPQAAFTRRERALHGRVTESLQQAVEEIRFQLPDTGVGSQQLREVAGQL